MSDAVGRGLMPVWDKLDPGLTSVYANYLRVNEVGADSAGHLHPVAASGGRLNVSLQCTGDLDDIEWLGFAPTWDVNRRAGGTLELADLERLAAHSGVRKMSYGRHARPTIYKSVPDIKANQTWSFANGAFGGASAGPSTESARKHS